MSVIETYEQISDIFVPQDVLVFDKGKALVLHAQLHTSEIIDKEVLRNDYETGFNKEVRTFHIMPETDTRSFMGVVSDIWWNDDVDEPFVELNLNEVGSHADAIRGMIIEDLDKPLEDRRIKGISAGIIGTYDKKTKKLVKFHIREVSLAREPVCEACTFQEILQYDGGNSMAENEMKRVIESFEKMNELATGYQTKTIEAQATTIAELEKKVERFSKTIGLLKDQHEELLRKFDESVTSIETFEKQVADKDKEIENVTKNPLISQILNFEKLDPKEDEGKKRLAELQEENSQSLTKMIAGYERILGLQDAGMLTNAPGNTMEFTGMGIQNYSNLSPQNRLKATNEAAGKKGAPRSIGEHVGSFGGGM